LGLGGFGVIEMTKVSDRTATIASSKTKELLDFSTLCRVLAQRFVAGKRQNLEKISLGFGQTACRGKMVKIFRQGRNDSFAKNKEFLFLCVVYLAYKALARGNGASKVV
jgi:hypothetical protein